MQEPRTLRTRAVEAVKICTRFSNKSAKVNIAGPEISDIHIKGNIVCNGLITFEKGGSIMPCELICTPVGKDTRVWNNIIKEWPTMRTEHEVKILADVPDGTYLEVTYTFP